MNLYFVKITKVASFYAVTKIDYFIFSKERIEEAAKLLINNSYWL